MPSLYSALPVTSTSRTVTVAPPHHESVLSPADSRAVLALEHDTGVRIRSLVSFLNSDDPGAAMPPATREAFLAQCDALNDCSYLEDRWPGVGTGDLKFPDHLPPPSFSPRHQQLAVQRAKAAVALAADIGKIPLSLLKQFCAPLHADLAELQDLINKLMTDCRPDICARLESFLSIIDRRAVPKDGTDCRVARDVQRVLHFDATALKPTIDALNTLLALGVGKGDGSFNRQTQPDYFDTWDRALKSMERADWSRFKVQIDLLHRLRADLLPPDLLPPGLPERPGWLQDSLSQSPPPLTPRRT
jgi:hypothetical protein